MNSNLKLGDFSIEFKYLEGKIPSSSSKGNAVDNSNSAFLLKVVFSICWDEVMFEYCSFSF